MDDVIYVFAGMVEAMRKKPTTMDSRAYVPKDAYDAVVAERDELQNSCNQLLDALAFTGKTMEKEVPAAYAAGVAAGKRGGTQ